MSFKGGWTGTPYKPLKSSKPAVKSGSTNIEGLKEEVEQTQEIMVENVKQIITKGEKLKDLLTEAKELDEKSSLFQKVAKKLKDKHWLEAHKSKLIIGAVFLFLLIAVVTALLITFL